MHALNPGQLRRHERGRSRIDLDELYIITEPSEVAEYERAYERLAELALGGRQAVEFIRGVMAGLDR